MSAFRLPADLVDQVTHLAGALESFVLDARDQFAERSERWQEGDDGTAVDGWLDELDELQSTLGGVPAVPE